MPSAIDQLSSLLDGPDIILAPGAYDALSAKLAAQAGAKAVYMTGFGVAGSTLRLEEHTSELQSLTNLVCRLLLEKKKTSHMRLAEINARLNELVSA